VTGAAEQLCKPRRVENMTTYCGTPSEIDEMCVEVKGHFVYVCGDCGRSAKQAELLCLPLMAG
jgi:hypothetical protein